MTEFGNSRISVDTQGGGIGALNLDATEKLVIFGRADVQNGSVSANDPTRVTSASQLEPTFGDSRLSDAMRDAAGNGQSFDAMFGVVPVQEQISGESVSGGTGQLVDAAGDPTPVIEDVSLTSVQNTTAGQSESVVFQYEDPIDTSSLGADEVAINPDTGTVAAGDTDDYEIDYEYLEWADAFDAASQVILPQESGQWAVLSDTDSVIGDAVAAAAPLRENQFKMIRVLGGATPNATASDGEPKIDPATYSDSVADESAFLFGPIREVGDPPETALGAIGGAMSSVSISDSILGESVTNVDGLAQQMPVPVQEDLKDINVIPVSDFGAPAIEGNVSTANSGRRQTFFTRRLADRLILAARAIGRSARGDVANNNTASVVQTRLNDELTELAADGLLESDADEGQSFFASATADPTDPKRLLVNFGFTPEGITDTVEFSATIDT
jgi:hypothetical protein